MKYVPNFTEREREREFEQSIKWSMWMSCHSRWAVTLEERKQNYRHSLKKKKTTQQLRITNSFLIVDGNFAPTSPFSMLEFCLVWTSTGVVPRKGKIWLTWILWKVKNLKFKKTSLLLLLLLLTFWLVISAWQDIFLYLEVDRRSFRLYLKHSSMMSPWFGIFFLLTSVFYLI